VSELYGVEAGECGELSIETVIGLQEEIGVCDRSHEQHRLMRLAVVQELIERVDPEALVDGILNRTFEY
jgi:hypothetical protein